MKRVRLGLVAWVLVGVFCLACGDAVALPASDPPLPLMEELVIGLDEDPPLGRIASVDIAADGSIFVLDGGYNVVRKYSADGEHLFDMGREGEGPGEFLNPRCLAVRSDGLVVVAGTSLWLTVFNPDGTPRDNVQRRFNSFVGSAAFAADGTLYVTSFDRGDKSVLQRFNGDALEEGISFGRLDDEKAAEARTPQEAIMDRARAAGPVAVAADGNLFYSPMVPQRIDVLTPDGTLTATNPARQDESRMPVVETSEGAMTVRVPTSCTALVPLSDGRYFAVLWQFLESTGEEGEAPDSEALVDLYAPDHQRLASWTLPDGFSLRARDAQDRLYVAESREIADGEEVPVLVRYRLTQPEGED